MKKLNLLVAICLTANTYCLAQSNNSYMHNVTYKFQNPKSRLTGFYRITQVLLNIPYKNLLLIPRYLHLTIK